jgi:CRP/FNR family cyclic AMP-dependent transcriptional regulator
MDTSGTRTLKNQNKKIFLIASIDSERRQVVSEWITKKFEDSLVYTASEYAECFQKIRNAPPSVLITDFVLAKSNSVQTIESLMQDEEYANLPIIVLGGTSQKVDYMDAVVTGKVQFVENIKNEVDLYPYLVRALNFASASSPSHYETKFLMPGDTLIQEGEISDKVFILKKGRLIASKIQDGKEEILGTIEAGEFVGEMGFLNDALRVATVKALEESQVVSIPVEIFDKVIFKRPSWSKLILSTISKRLSATLKRQAP